MSANAGNSFFSRELEGYQTLRLQTGMQTNIYCSARILQFFRFFQKSLKIGNYSKIHNLTIFMGGFESGTQVTQVRR